MPKTPSTTRHASLPRVQIEGEQRGLGRALRAPTSQQVQLLRRQAVDAEQLAAAGHDRVVPELVGGLALPEHLTGKAVHHHHVLAARREGLVQAYGDGPVSLGDIERGGAGDEEVFIDAEVSPVSRVCAGDRREAELGEGLSGGRVEHEALLTLGDVNAIHGGHVVAAGVVGAGDVLLVIATVIRVGIVAFVVVAAEGIEVGQFFTPEQAARVDIAGAHKPDTLDEETSTDDLLRRTIRVPGQHVEVGGSPKPKQAERRLHQVILGADGIRDITVLVRPWRRSRQGPRAA